MTGCLGEKLGTTRNREISWGGCFVDKNRWRKVGMLIHSMFQSERSNVDVLEKKRIPVVASLGLVGDRGVQNRVN